MIKKLLIYGFVRHSLALITPDIFQIILRALTALVTAKILGPENMGLVAAVGLVMSYGALLQGGITDGVGLKVPLLIGQKKNKEAELYLNHGFTGVLTIMLAFTLIIISLSYFIFSDELVYYGIVANAICLLVFQVQQYLEAKARLFFNFRAVYYSKTILATSQFILTVTGTYYYGIHGFFAALMLFYIPSIIYLRFKRSKVLFYKWDVRANIELIKIGFPVLLGGIIATLFTSIDKWFILTNFGVESLGYYSMIIGLAAMVSMVPERFASLLRQYLIEASGADCPSERMWGYAFSLLLMVAILCIPLVMVAGHFTHFVIGVYLTQFEPSLPLVEIVLLSVYVASIFSFCSAFLIAADQTVLILKVQALGLVITVLLNSLAIYMNSGLMGIAVATLAANIFLNIIILYCVYSMKIGVKFMELFSILAIYLLGGSIVLLSINLTSISGYSMFENTILFLQRAGWDLLLLLSLAGFVYYSKMYKSLEGFVDRDFSV
jgi:O-antigen/teichoic acid export membrane protein